MYTVILECDSGHAFEGWFDSVEDYEARLEQTGFSCPVCDSEFVMRKSSAHSKPGRALMELARRIRHQSDRGIDQSGSQYFKLLLD